MVLRFFLFVVVFLFISCHTVERDNPEDPSSRNYVGASSSSSSINYGSLIYEDKTYKTVVIGEQTWMAENLTVVRTGNKCYGNSNANCLKYGRLYDWATAMNLPSDCNSFSCEFLVMEKHQGICPKGWHIPDFEDFLMLNNYVEEQKSCSACSGIYLKAENEWKGGEQKNDFGFSALPGGYYDGVLNDFDEIVESGTWWTATEEDDKSLFVFLGYNQDVLGGGYYSKKSFISVRCLKD